MTTLVQKAYFSEQTGDTFHSTQHYHDCHQLILITHGHIRFWVNNTSYEAKAGEMVIFSRYENHTVTVLSEAYKRYVLQIDPKAVGIENRGYALLLNRPIGFCNAVDVRAQQSEIEQLFRLLIDECDRPQKLSEEMQQLLVNQLLILLYRNLPDTSYFEEKTAKIIYAIQRQFEAQSFLEYSLVSLAKEYNISVSSLSHLFKKYTGFSVMDYLLSCRMASAKNFLSCTDFTVGEIIEKCGFSDSSNFSRTFKKLNGISPSAFRAKYKVK